MRVMNVEETMELEHRNEIFVMNPSVRRRVIRKFPGVDLDLIPEDEWLTILDEAYHVDRRNGDDSAELVCA
jgi:hypothetical protein